MSVNHGDATSVGCDGRDHLRVVHLNAYEARVGDDGASRAHAHPGSRLRKNLGKVAPVSSE